MNRYTFEEQYTTFQTRGYTQEPSGAGYVGDAHALAAAHGALASLAIRARYAALAHTAVGRCLLSACLTLSARVCTR